MSVSPCGYTVAELEALRQEGLRRGDVVPMSDEQHEALLARLRESVERARAASRAC